MAKYSFDDAILKLKDDDVQVRKDAIKSLEGVTDEGEYVFVKQPIVRK